MDSLVLNQVFSESFEELKQGIHNVFDEWQAKNQEFYKKIANSLAAISESLDVLAELEEGDANLVQFGASGNSAIHGTNHTLIQFNNNSLGASNPDLGPNIIPAECVATSTLHVQDSTKHNHTPKQVLHCAAPVKILLPYFVCPPMLIDGFRPDDISVTLLVNTDRSTFRIAIAKTCFDLKSDANFEVISTIIFDPGISIDVEDGWGTLEFYCVLANNYKVSFNLRFENPINLVWEDYNYGVESSPILFVSKFQNALEDVRLHTLSKQVFMIMRTRHYPGSINLFKLPAFACVYGLKKTLYGIHGFAGPIIQILNGNSSHTTHGIIHVLMKFLSYVKANVQLRALEAWLHMTMHHLQVVASFLLILIGSLRVRIAFVKSVAFLSFPDLKEWTLLISCIHCLKSKLEIYIGGEANMYDTLSQVGCTQGPLVIFIVLEEFAPSFDCKRNMKTIYDIIILVGNSTRIPKVQQSFPNNFLGQEFAERFYQGKANANGPIAELLVLTINEPAITPLMSGIGVRGHVLALVFDPGGRTLSILSHEAVNGACEELNTPIDGSFAMMLALFQLLTCSRTLRTRSI